VVGIVGRHSHAFKLFGHHISALLQEEEKRAAEIKKFFSEAIKSRDFFLVQLLLSHFFMGYSIFDIAIVGDELM
jgi:hypothetical protein